MSSLYWRRHSVFQITLLIFFSISLFSQGRRDYIWVLGGTNSVSGIDSNFNRFTFDFNKKPLEIKRIKKYFRIHQNNASICDKDGNLLIHTTGCYISDRLMRPMPNGKINEGFTWDFICKDEDYPVFLGSLIIPVANDEYKYIVLHKFDEFDVGPTKRTVVTRLLYSVVDMRLNNGYGDVVSKNNVVLNEFLTYSELTATRHSNNKDWWILVQSETGNSYYKIRISDDKVEYTGEQKIGRESMDYGGGQSCFSPDGRQYARMTMQDGLYLFDFDRETGQLSSFRHHLTGQENFDFSTGVAFSPNSRYVYITTEVDLYQLDTEVQDLSSSLVHIDTWDGYVDEGIWAAQFSHMMLAPDCKIYMRSRTSNRVMHVIHSPNQKGKACNFEQHGVHLPAWNHASIPNFVNYRLGYEPVCDSSLVMNWDPGLHKYQKELIIYPQPASIQLHLELWDRNASIDRIRITDLQGKEVLCQQVMNYSYRYSIDISHMESGIYFVSVQDRKGTFYSSKFLKQ
ncbi:MAG: T9SS type A sorting domain-containing protein [Saprospiraceae bacterium]